ncbi:thioredoxin family protein [Cellulophaga baltica]|uniref:thioredoxin family protein n=1 Tax=Cellulophaga TaxID=104264 RepID=UPI001C0715F7|nr:MULTISPECIES: thioredoxin family protein [Cellulophaga]MBU2996910.1 thioredoxin family protein [Cellulophaga baltica]MDO6768308.1 thioredoxin family protein [Cellulophaga sp. 1_MG-2023]
MKNIIAIIFLFLINIVSSQNWHKTYNDAVVDAKENNKSLILVFSGSDWCAPCIKLDRKIWQSEEFVVYAEKHYSLYKADFPRKKVNQLPEDLLDVNKALAEKYNTKGYYPLVVVLNSENEFLGETGYIKVIPKDYIAILNAFID